MSEQGAKLRVKVNGLTTMNTDDLPHLLQDGEIAFAENMVSSNGGYANRLGSKIFKSNSQWEDVAVIFGIAYKLGDSPAEVAFLLEDGRLYTAGVTAISSDPVRIFNPTISYTLRHTFTITDKNEAYIEVLNNQVFVCVGSNQLFYYGDDHVIRAAPDPLGFEITMTVNAAVAATIDARYEDDDDTTRIFNVELSKTGGSGTTLILRQVAGSTRPDATGDLSKISGVGDDNIAWTAISYSENFIALGKRDARLSLVSSIGDVILSHPNRGADFVSDQVERIPYGKVDGLKVTNVTNFKRGTVLSLSEPQIRKSALGILTGYRKYDVNTPDRTDGLFKVDRESNMFAFLGRSGLEVGNGFIGLTRNGFIDFAAIQSSTEFGITDADYISNNIKNVINRIDWTKTDGVRSCIDETNQRYWCAVPVDGAESNTLVLVYDFSASFKAVRNMGALHRWSFYTFNFGEITIESLFTLFGHPCIGLSDGRVVMCEIENHYFDDEAIYPTSLIIKKHDFGIRTHMKSWECGTLDLQISLPEDKKAIELDIIPVIDDNYHKTNWDKQRNTLKYIHPRKVDQDDLWTLDQADLWTLNPFDVWGSSYTEETPFGLSNIPNFRDLSLVITNRQGGYKWGIYGYEMIANLGDKHYDPRLVNVNKSLNKGSAEV
jgi:hypothetical protein